MKTKFTFLAIVFTVLFASGCAHVQPPISLPSTYLANNAKPTIGVVKASTPTARTVNTGSMGLLDYAIVAAMNASLTDHLESLDLSEFSDLHTLMIEKLKADGFKVVFIDDEINWERLPKFGEQVGFAVKDFRDFKTKYHVDQLLVLQLVSAGTTRSYYGPMPTSEPQAFATAQGQLVDLSNNQLVWYFEAKENIAINGAWDEPDLQFPLITNSLYQCVESAKNNLQSSFYR